MRHLASVLCQRVVVDEDSGQFSLMGLISGIRGVPLTEQTPASGPENIPIPFKLVSLWMRSNLDIPETPAVLITFCGPDGTVADGFQAEFTVDLDQAVFRRSKADISGIPYLGAGVCEFVVHQKQDDEWQELARVPLVVHVDALPEEASRTETPN